MKLALLFLFCVTFNLAAEINEESRRRGDIDPAYDYVFDDESNYDDPCLTKPSCRYNCDNGLPCKCECKP